MKYSTLYLFLFAAILCFACKNEQPPVEIKINKDSLLLFKLPIANEKIIGTYSGDFGDAPIRIVLRFISGKNISGYNIHKGIKRNLKGNIAFENNQLHLLLSEPGTEKFDGRFDLYIDTGSFKGGGTWYPTVTTTLGKKAFSFAKNNEPSFFSYTEFTDTLNNTIFLRENGVCQYNYFINPKTETEQKLSINGSYTYKAENLIIYWQPNNLFQEKNYSFKVIKEFNAEMEDTTKTIVGKMGKFTEIYMP